MVGIEARLDDISSQVYLLRASLQQQLHLLEGISVALNSLHRAVSAQQAQIRGVEDVLRKQI